MLEQQMSHYIKENTTTLVFVCICIKYFYCIHSCVKLQEHIKFVGDFSVSFSMQGIACLGNYKTCLSMKKGDLILVMEFTLLTVLQSA